MKVSLFSRAVGLMALALALQAAPARAGSPSTCDLLATDIRQAVAKDPSKVLMIVEDGLVINETCACEIVKAAIQASSADGAMVQQIVQTAMAVAPKMAAIIAECAAAVAPGSSEAINAVAAARTDTTDRSKEVRESVAKAPVEPVAPGTEFLGGTYIRGVYLIQPAAAGYLSVCECEDREEEKDEGKKTSKKAESHRTCRRLPLSPSYATAG